MTHFGKVLILAAWVLMLAIIATTINWVSAALNHR